MALTIRVGSLPQAEVVDILVEELCVDAYGTMASVFRQEKLKKVLWTPLFADTVHYSEESTNRLTGGAGLGEFGWREPCCFGIMALRREVFVETGGYDERFRGWGMEDAAFRRVLVNLYGDENPVGTTVTALWHDPGNRGKASPESWSLIREYEDLGNDKERTLEYLSRRGSFV